MATNAGVWIDHRKAVIVILTESGERLIHIDSDAEKRVRSAGGSQSRSTNSAQSAPAEDVLDRKFANNLNVYYKEVFDCLKDSDGILVMGPGEARTEFQKHFHSKGAAVRIAANEKCDKMTDPQIVARVREYFQAEVGR
jgi:hypothetical protein